MSLKMRNVILILLLSISLCLPASAQYKANQAGQGFQVREGTIQTIREVQLEGEAGLGGTAAGGALGYAAGQAVGGGSGNKAARIGGTVAGAALGRRAQRNIRTTTGLEIVVKLDDGRTWGIVQEKDGDFRKGDRVRIMEARDGSLRVDRVG